MTSARRADPLPSVAVWPLHVRVMHWALALSVAISWLTDEATLGPHQAAGYLAAALVIVRLLVGFLGSGEHVRFSAFVRAPGAVWHYAREVIRHRDPRFLGHNPLGGWMICALLLCVLVTSLTGWLYTLDAFWGYAWLEWTHRASAWLLLVLIGGHLGGVLFTSRRHRENLVVAMLTGRKAVHPVQPSRPASGRKA
ncbi:MAG: cytochrome b/b6 domain-containing protein [Lautropia sp.]